MKKRVTTTLSSELLQAIDGQVAAGEFDTRSYAIESLLRKALTSTVKKAAILAGGKGVKMRPFTYEMPKALLPVSGKPLLEHTLELLREQRILDVILCIGHLGDEIIKHFGNGEKFGVNVHYSQEKEPLGTAGALKHGEPFYSGETILVLHGDVLTNMALNDFIAFHNEQQAAATIAVKPRPHSEKYGKVLMLGPKITDFFERPSVRGVSLVNAGIYVLEPEVMQMIPEGKRIYLELEIFPKLAKEGKVAGYPFQGPWFDISTPKTYEEAIKRWGKERG